MKKVISIIAYEDEDVDGKEKLKLFQKLKT